MITSCYPSFLGIKNCVICSWFMDSTLCSLYYLTYVCFYKAIFLIFFYKFHLKTHFLFSKTGSGFLRNTTSTKLEIGFQVEFVKKIWPKKLCCCCQSTHTFYQIFLMIKTQLLVDFSLISNLVLLRSCYSSPSCMT